MAEDTSSLENTSAAALISLKGSGVKAGTFPVTPTRRGHPVRIRKPNPRIFGDEDDETLRYPKPKRTKVTSTPQKQNTLSTPDKKAAQSIGLRLKNLLKLPKAHKWVCYEWFYSNIDQSLFQGENDFCICLRESFPQLKTRRLTRVQWVKVRRLMGKPRRCSPAFFAEERAALQRKREKIRMLQQRKSADVIDLKDLPDEIPMSLVIGTKVTARLRKPQDGLFTGRVDALDTVNNTYRITFDRQGLGTHSVPDVEVLSNDPQETMPLLTFQARARPRTNVFTPPRFIPGNTSPTLLSDNDPLLGSSPLKAKLSNIEDGTYGGFPVKFLVLITRLTKIMTRKRDKVQKLADMNTEAEKMRSLAQEFPTHFQQKYAATVLELEKLNTELNEHLLGVTKYAGDILVTDGAPVVDTANDLKQNCDEDADDMVNRTNITLQHKKMVQSTRSLELITRLTSLLLQIKHFAESDMHSFEFSSLQNALSEIKANIDPSNTQAFENNVEIHINHVQSGLSQMGNLHAFAASEGAY